MLYVQGFNTYGSIERLSVKIIAKAIVDNRVPILWWYHE